METAPTCILQNVGSWGFVLSILQGLGLGFRGVLLGSDLVDATGFGF